MTEFDEKLCDERHKNIEHLLEKIDKSVNVLFNRLNWFYVVAIGTLASAISAIIISCVR